MSKMTSVKFTRLGKTRFGGLKVYVIRRGNFPRFTVSAKTVSFYVKTNQVCIKFTGPLLSDFGNRVHLD